jgi:hypothetical protein
MNCAARRATEGPRGVDELDQQLVATEERVYRCDEVDEPERAARRDRIGVHDQIAPPGQALVVARFVVGARIAPEVCGERRVREEDVEQDGARRAQEQRERIEISQPVALHSWVVASDPQGDEQVQNRRDHDCKNSVD